MAQDTSVSETVSDRPYRAKHSQIQPVVDFAEGDDTIVISYRFSGHTGTGRNGAGHGADNRNTPADEVGISGAGFFSESGKPLLPSFGRFVQLPPRVGFTVDCETHDHQVIEGYRIKPAQENVTDQEEGTFEFDQDAYEQDHLYPPEIMGWSGPHYLDAYRVICLHVRPLQYNPKQALLHFYRAVTVTIHLLPESTATPEPGHMTEPPSSAFEPPSKSLQGFGNLVFNPDRTVFARQPMAVPASPRAGEPPEIPNFLIVYGNGLQEPALRLKAWKDRRGIETGVVPAQDIFGSAAGDGEKTDRIKAYLRGKRQARGSALRYVLFLGEVDKIPTESVSGIQTDYYYCTHTDARGGQCLLPWISGGRIPVGDRDAATAVVDKIIHYEKHPPHDPDYFTRMTLAAYFQDSDRSGRQDGRADMAYVHTMERIREHMLARGFVVNRVYVTNSENPRCYSDGSPVPMAVQGAMIHKAQGRIATKRLLSQINQGQLLVSHRGHGSKWGWQQPRFSTAEVKSLSNDYPSVFFSINCLTGSFKGHKDTFAEEILKSRGTAPSLIAATANSGSWRNDSMVKALFDAVWPGIIQTFPPAVGLPVKYHRMGDLLNYAKAFLLVSHDVNGTTKKQLEIYHVIGDPTLEFWGERPADLTLHARILKDKLLINMNTCPNDAVLTLWYGGTCLMRKEPTVARLAVPLSLFDQLPDDSLDPARDRPYAIDVCLYAPGHRFAASTLWF